MSQPLSTDLGQHLVDGILGDVVVVFRVILLGNGLDFENFLGERMHGGIASILPRSLQAGLNDSQSAAIGVVEKNQ